MVLDGEIVAFSEGRPDFEALQSRMHVSSPAQARRLAETVPVTYLAFDLLQLDGRPLAALPYAERRDILTPIIPNGGWLALPAQPSPVRISTLSSLPPRPAGWRAWWPSGWTPGTSRVPGPAPG